MKTFKTSDGILLPHPFQYHDQYDGHQLTTLDALELHTQQLKTNIQHLQNIERDTQAEDDYQADLIDLRAAEANLDHLINEYHLNLTNNHEPVASNKAMARLTGIVLWTPDETTPATDDEGEFRLSPGDHIFTLPDTIASLWGNGENILWAKGEPLMIYGPTGIGKTTLAGNLLLSLIGINPTDLLGYPITPLPDPQRILYVAADRPRQAMRSLKRMVTPKAKTILHNRLRIEHNRAIWTNDTDPNLLWRACQQANATALFLDSTKDIASGPLKEENTAKAFMDAIQVCIANEIDVLMLHHPRKGARDSDGDPGIDSVYGSTWLTAGSGSVLLVAGEPGSSLFTIEQLKAPATFIDKMHVKVDYDTGHLERKSFTDMIGWLKAAHPQTVTVREAAAWLGDTSTGDVETSSKEYKSAARKLSDGVKGGSLIRYKKAKDGADTYQWAEPMEIDPTYLEEPVL